MANSSPLAFGRDLRRGWERARCVPDQLWWLRLVRVELPEGAAMRCPGGFLDCPPDGRRCKACGGCCNWCSSAHLTDGEWDVIAPMGTKLEILVYSVWEPCESYGLDPTPWGDDRIAVSPKKAPNRFWLRRDECGGVFYEVERRPNGALVGGGGGGVKGVRVVQEAARQMEMTL